MQPRLVSLQAELCPLNPLVSLHIGGVLCIFLRLPYYILIRNRRMFKATSFLAKDASSMSPITQPNQFKPQKLWPPDFSKLNEQQQFRFERKYRRRAKLKYTRPGWNKGVKLTSWVACSCMAVLPSYRWQTVTHSIVIAVFVYGILFMDWGTEKTQFQGVGLRSEPNGQYRILIH